MGETMLTTVMLSTTGMHCPSCSMLIELKLRKLEGVQEVRSDYIKQETTVSFDQGIVDIAKIFATIEEAGYRAKVLA